MLDAVNNRKPPRLPLYEHTISEKIMERITGKEMTGLDLENAADRKAFFTRYCAFFRDMTYDTVSYEVCISEILPDHGAILGGRPGPIQTRSDFENYPWASLPGLFWQKAAPCFDALRAAMPAGMKAVGGVGNGCFEISEDLVGYEYLGFMMADDPELFSELYRRIGDLMYDLWERLLQCYGDIFVICRFGDDLGFRSSLLVSPETIIDHIVPAYRRIIDLVHRHEKPFLLHSCGNIFPIMDDLIGLGINAKHSNEDAIAPFEEWIGRYHDRIALFGGIDVDILCRNTPAQVFDDVRIRGAKYRSMAGGYALGSGNSIPDYVNHECYLSMIEAAGAIRAAD